MKSKSLFCRSDKSLHDKSIKFHFAKLRIFICVNVFQHAYSYRLRHTYRTMSKPFCKETKPPEFIKCVFSFFSLFYLQCKVYIILQPLLSEQTRSISIQSHHTHISISSLSLSLCVSCFYITCKKETGLQINTNDDISFKCGDTQHK